jgi:hypothetical protein
MKTGITLEKKIYIIKRIKAACRTNEPQAIAVIAMSLAMLMAYIGRKDSFNPIIAISLLFVWTVIAFIINLIDPI